jgi:hypothetical protein
MLKTPATVTALVIAALSLPATAGSWPNLPAKKFQASIANAPVAATPATGYVAGSEEGGWSLEQYRYFRDEDQPNQRARTPLATSAPSAATTASTSANGFQFVGGDTGWQPVGHTFVMKNGALAHSDQCDHMIRTVQGPTPAEVEAARSLSPGG